LNEEVRQSLEQAGIAALGVGEQLNWLDAVEEGDGAEAA
jgi:hypothetical protein